MRSNGANDDIAGGAGRRLPKKTQHLRDLSQHNIWLLEEVEIERNQQALEVLKPHHRGRPCAG